MIGISIIRYYMWNLPFNIFPSIAVTSHDFVSACLDSLQLRYMDEFSFLLPVTLWDFHPSCDYIVFRDQV